MTTMNQNPNPIICVLGAPAAGKGTLCKMLAAEFGFAHLSIGDALRAYSSSPTADPNAVEKVKNGELLTIEELAPILESKINEEKRKGPKVILLDGFPRKLEQAAPVEHLIGSPVLVLFFDCIKEVAEIRFVDRQLQGRESDTVETFRKRYAEFARLNSSILERYRERNILIKINTSGLTRASYDVLLHALNESVIWKDISCTNVKNE